MKQKILYLTIGLLIGVVLTVLFNLLTKTSGQKLEKLPTPFYSVLFENEHIRVIDHKLNPGETEPMHQHPSMYVYFLEDAEVEIIGPDGNKTSESLKKEQNFLAPALSHSIDNRGNTVLHSILVELK
ncbi:cupin domain-containing protein [Algoriphagus marinus]|uniref:hypothetical protein n=1 Tax=Algoriphagus marinus TaxID=1925762 RepID=UPI00094BAFC2|nr:hypothetical protein [Algoriphagus marinus]